ncbi:MAG TPA: SPOR domain-containing protein, partial [Blastocatellia bacterium]|nr:SPOR domain-containing protein [Blastocatellia bacterium]
GPASTSASDRQPSGEQVGGNRERANANTRYVVTVAAFGTSQEANQLTSELRRKYLSTYTQEPSGSDTLYRVNIGPYDKREAAEQVQQELVAEGRKGIMIIQQDQK